MSNKITLWFGASFFILVFLRSIFYLFLKFHAVHSFELFDLMVMIPLCLFSLALSYMFIRKIFGRS